MDSGCQWSLPWRIILLFFVYFSSVFKHLYDFESNREIQPSILQVQNIDAIPPPKKEDIDEMICPVKNDCPLWNIIRRRP
jgi:hypothetical protein